MKIKLMYGDCLDRLKEIKDNSIDLIITDPPYKLSTGGRTGPKTPKGGIFTENHQEFKDGTIFKHNSIKFNEWVPEVFKKLKDNSHIYIMSNGRNLKDLLTEMDKHGNYKNIISWDKGNVTPNRNYMQRIEFIVLYGKGKCRGINDMGKANLISIKNEIGRKVHPTQKPVELMKELILNSSNPNDLILDPFLGSGSTGVAAIQENRNFIGIEKDKNYFKIARDRIQNEYKIK